MLSSLYYAINYAGIIDRDLTGDLLFRIKISGIIWIVQNLKNVYTHKPKAEIWQF